MADLPPSNTKRWVVRRKAAVLAAVRAGAITIEEACRRYALSEEETARFESHIGRCDGCNVYLEQVRQTIVMTGRLSEDALTPEAERALLDAFRGWHAG